jgi:hypothetical protein
VCLLGAFFYYLRIWAIFVDFLPENTKSRGICFSSERWVGWVFILTHPHYALTCSFNVPRQTKLQYNPRGIHSVISLIKSSRMQEGRGEDGKVRARAGKEEAASSSDSAPESAHGGGGGGGGSVGIRELAGCLTSSSTFICTARHRRQTESAGSECDVKGT